MSTKSDGIEVEGGETESKVFFWIAESLGSMIEHIFERHTCPHF